MRVLVALLLLLAMVGHSSAAYCLCKDGLPDKQLQTALDYACGAGADCISIQQNGACFQPNTVKSHCDWAVNSYFQRKGQVAGSCDFSGTATPSANPPSSVSSACVYPSSPSNAGTPTTTTPTSTTPTTTTTTGGTTSPGVFPGNTGLAPTGINDGSNGASLIIRSTNLFLSFALTLWFSGLVFLWGQ